jgi:hypothetical protein
MNFARDPNSRRGRYNLPGTYFDRDKGDKDEAVPIENIN